MTQERLDMPRKRGDPQLTVHNLNVFDDLVMAG